MDFPLARQFFYKEIYQPEEQINLAKAALYIAQEEYPDLDPDEYLNALDTMASEVRERLPDQRYPLRVIQAINQYLYDDLNFTGNKDDYYDPRNSYLNDVIERRTGIPITLALLYLEIAKRVDFPMVGIGMPGHFLIRPDFPDAAIYVDAFNSGEILFEQDCQERLSELYQQPVQMKASFLEAVNNRRFLSRMLMNLKLIYLNRNELSKALAVVERLLLLFPGTPMELRDRGLLYYQIGEWMLAYQDLETYLVRVPGAEDAIAIRKLIEQIQPEI
jgi:regulator of sirC expression with transglutaminase-like and TPR domain